MTTIENIIRPIVEGQLRDFVRAHPAILEGVLWYNHGNGMGNNREDVFVNSVAKRIVRDLVSEHTIARLREAVATPSAASGAGRGGAAVPPRFTLEDIMNLVNTSGLKVSKERNTIANVGKAPELALAESLNGVMDKKLRQQEKKNENA